MKRARHSTRPASSALLAGLLFLVCPVPPVGAQAPESHQAVEPREDSFGKYLQLLVVERAENWMQRQIREFRTFRHLDRAYRLLAQNRLAEARVELEKYLAIDPEDVKVWSTLMIVRQKMDDVPGVVEAANAILRRRPAWVPALLYRGFAEQSRHALDRAAGDFEAAAATPGIAASDRRFALNMLADVRMRQKAFEQAAAVLRTLAEVEHDASVYLRYGMALEALQRLPEAQAAFVRAASATPIKPADRTLALSMVAEVAIRQRRYEDALEPARELAAADPGFRAQFRLGMVLENMGRLGEAAAAYGKAVAAATDVESQTRAWRSAAEVARKGRRWREAYDASIAAHELRPDDAGILSELGRLCHSWGRDREALEWTRRALAVRPDRSDRELLATLLFAAGDHAGAAGEWAALLREPHGREERRRLLISLANARTALGDYAAATRLLHQAQDIRPDAGMADALGQSLEREGRRDEAIVSSRTALSLQPTPSRHHRLGTLLAEEGKLEEALEHLGEALAGTSPAAERAAILKQQGFLHFRMRHYSEARVAFESALGMPAEDPEILAALGQTCLKLGAFGDAVSYLRKAAAADPGSEVLRALAQSQAAAGRPGEAIETYRRVLRALPGDSPEAREVRMSLANLLASAGRHREAALLFVEAYERGGASSRAALGQAAESFGLAGDWAAAADADRRLLLEGITAEDRGIAAERLGHACLRLNQPDLAAAAFRQALASGRDRPELREHLGYALVRTGAKAEALEQFESALVGRRTPRLLLEVGSLYADVGKPGIAIHFLEEAAPSASELDRDGQRLLWTSLGQLYAGQADYEKARTAWERAQSIETQPATGLALARTERLLGRPQAALARLEAIDVSRLTRPEQAQRWDEFAEIYRSERAFEKAIEALEKGNRLEARAERYYRIGLNQADLGRQTAAIEAFEEAVAGEPGNTRYSEALGYAYRRSGRTAEAADLFESVVQSDPDYIRLYEDLGYLQMERSRNGEAGRWFRTAIDNSVLRPTPSPEAEEELRLDVFRMRGEVSRLEQRLTTTFYVSPTFGSRRLASVPGGPNGGVLPAQAGIEVAYQPPRIGLRNGRVFQVFGRFLSNVQPGTLQFQSESFLGGVGARYKPFKAQNVFVSVERLFKIGDQSANNWLLRTMYSWNCGLEMQSEKRAWNYTTIYADAAYFVQSPRRGALYGEARQGVAIRIGDRLQLTPHLVADVRHENPGVAIGSYLESGGGLSLKFTPAGRKYERSRMSFELLAHYRVGRFLKDSGTTLDDLLFSGWVLALICQF